MGSPTAGAAGVGAADEERDGDGVFDDEFPLAPGVGVAEDATGVRAGLTPAPTTDRTPATTGVVPDTMTV